MWVVFSALEIFGPSIRCKIQEFICLESYPRENGEEINRLEENVLI